MTAYYVSVIDGPRRGLLLGPLNTHDEALELVPAVTRKANELDPRAAFYAFGTASIDLAPGETAPHGKLNQFFDTIGKRYDALIQDINASLYDECPDCGGSKPTASARCFTCTADKFAANLGAQPPNAAGCPGRINQNGGTK